MPLLLSTIVLLRLLPIDASAHGPAVDHQLRLCLWIILTLAAFAHVLIFFGLALRRSTSPRDLWAIEYIPLAALALLFTALAVRAEHLWAATRYTGASLEAMQIEVTGMQFAWYFRYPGPDATFGVTHPQLADAATGNPLGIDPTDPHSRDDLVASELVLPADREIDLTIRALDVIHGLSIPELRLKQNAIPGEPIHIHFTPVRPGTYAILCTQLCGLGHYRMNANLRVLPYQEFESWLATKEKATHP